MLWSTRDYCLKILWGLGIVTGLGTVLVWLPNALDIYAFSLQARLLLWVALAGITLFYTVTNIETFYCRQHSSLPAPKDLSVGFTGLASDVVEEAELSRRLHLLGCTQVEDVSFLYDLSEYFFIEDQLKSKIDQTAIKENAMKFNQHFAQNRTAFFRSGAGFITFTTVSARELFLDMVKGRRLPKRLDQSEMRRSAQPLSRAATNMGANLTDNSLLCSLHDPRLLSKLANRITALLGPDFRAFRPPPPSDVCFNYKKSRFTAIEQTLRFVIILVLGPTLHYWCNCAYFRIHLHCETDIVSSVDYVKYISLMALNIFIEHCVFTAIDILFYERKYLQNSIRYNQALVYTSIYNALTGVLLPSIAMKRAVVQWVNISAPSSEQRAHVISSLLSSLRIDFCLLIFSVFNFKLFKPALKSLLGRASQSCQIAAGNEEIVFTLSFAVSTILTISFYSTLQPQVFPIFLAALLGIILLDKKRAITERQSRGIYVFTDNPITPSTHNEELPDKHQSTESLPITAYSTVLCAIALYIVSAAWFSYYGFTLRFESIKRLPLKSKGYFGIFWEKLSERHEKSVWDPTHIDPSKGTLVGLVEKIQNSIQFFSEQAIAVKLLWGAYLISAIIFVKRNHQKAFEARIQSKVTPIFLEKRTDMITGKSYRSVNPAYQLGAYSEKVREIA